jgi:hypothetical protein
VLEAELKNAATAQRINQMMTQQIMQNNKGMQQDLGRALGLISELQYKILALQTVTAVDLTKVAEVADGLRLKDFNEASDKEDMEEGFTIGTVVNAESVVVLTSKTIAEDGTESADKGIFRSKIKLSEAGVPDLYSAFEGREVGAKAIVKLNGLDHEVEILAIRQPPVVVEVTSAPVEGNA